MSEQQESKPFDPFELTAAVLLGLGAIAASIAGHQGNLWGGQSVEAYGAAAAMTTKASTTYNDELATYNVDVAIDVRAKELIWESQEVEDETEANRKSGMAAWMLISQLSDAAYKHLGLPEEERKSYMEGNEDAGLTDEQLDTALMTDLSDEYVDEVFGTSAQEFEDADKRFAEGSRANSIGDQFSLAGVIFTVALFFAGLSLIFKTKMRWGFLGLGTVVFIAGIVFMSSLTWA